jgi:HSP20 family molecular chaperone IbpA
MNELITKPNRWNSIWDEFDSFFYPPVENKSKPKQYEANVAGYSKGEVTVEQDGDNIYIIAKNDSRGEKRFRIYLYEDQYIKSVKYEHGLLLVDVDVKQPEKNIKKIKIE